MLGSDFSKIMLGGMPAAASIKLALNPIARNLNC